MARSPHNSIQEFTHGHVSDVHGANPVIWVTRRIIASKPLLCGVHARLNRHPELYAGPANLRSREAEAADSVIQPCWWGHAHSADRHNATCRRKRVLPSYAEDRVQYTSHIRGRGAQVYCIVQFRGRKLDTKGDSVPPPKPHERVESRLVLHAVGRNAAGEKVGDRDVWMLLCAAYTRGDCDCGTPLPQHEPLDPAMTVVVPQ